MRACWAATILVLVQPSPASCATCRGTSVVPQVLVLTRRHLHKSPCARQPFAEISGNISFSPPVFPFPETVPNFVCHFKGSLHSVQVLSNAIERLKGSPASPGPKRVFRTVVSELARGLTCPCKPVGHANEHKRTIKPGILTGLVQQANVRANMSIDELARTYIARIEWQQRAQSTGQFPLIRDTSGCAPHFSAGTRFQSTSGGRIHCEECGLWMNARKCCGARVMSMHWP